MTRRVDLPGRYDPSLSLAPLRRGPYDPAFHVDASGVWQAMRTPLGPATVRLRSSSAEAVLAETWGPGAAWADAHLEDLLGVHDAPEAFSPADPEVAELHRRTPGLRLPRTHRVLDALIPAVLEQRVPSVDAFASWRRLLLRFGHRAPGPAPVGLVVAPSAAEWAAIPVWGWHRAGVSPQRYRAAQACARVGDRLEALTADRLGPALRAVPGIGRWTVAETIARVHGDADAVPWGDYHLGRLVGTALGGGVVEDEAVIAGLLEPYRPHRYRLLRLLTLHTRVPRRGPRLPLVDHRGR